MRVPSSWPRQHEPTRSTAQDGSASPRNQVRSAIHITQPAARRADPDRHSLPLPHRDWSKQHFRPRALMWRHPDRQILPSCRGDERSLPVEQSARARARLAPPPDAERSGGHRPWIWPRPIADGVPSETPAVADFRTSGHAPEVGLASGSRHRVPNRLAAHSPSFALIRPSKRWRLGLRTRIATSASTAGRGAPCGLELDRISTDRAPVTLRACARGASGPAAAAPASADAWRTRPRPGA